VSVVLVVPFLVQHIGQLHQHAATGRRADEARDHARSMTSLVSRQSFCVDVVGESDQRCGSSPTLPMRSRSTACPSASW
jgi:hypothetical protein